MKRDEYVMICIKKIKQHLIERALTKTPSASTMSDLLGENKNGTLNNPSLLTYILPFVYGRLFDNNSNKVLSERSIKFRQKVLFNSLRKGASKILTKELIIDKKVENNPEEPVIYAFNHGFVEDSVTPAIITGKSGYFISGNMAMSLNSVYGLLMYMNGTIFLNRRNKQSKQSIINKSVDALRMGTSLYFYPEGVWNKTINQLTLNFWPGIVRVAHKAKAYIVPVIQLPVGNKIYASQLEPFDVSAYGEENLHKALEDLRTIFNTELWRLMEKYAQFSHNELLGNFSDLSEMYEEHLKTVVADSGEYYDYPIEISADYRPKNILNVEDVWTPIAKLKITSQNADHVIYAKNLVSTIQREDYQHRF